MIKDLLRGRWYLARQSLNLREDPELQQYEIQGETWVLSRRIPDDWLAALQFEEGTCQYEAAPVGSPYESGLYTWGLDSDNVLFFEFWDRGTQRVRILYLGEQEMKLAFE
jgi:hypothetical protein